MIRSHVRRESIDHHPRKNPDQTGPNKPIPGKFSARQMLLLARSDPLVLENTTSCCILSSSTNAGSKKVIYIWLGVGVPGSCASKAIKLFCLASPPQLFLLPKVQDIALVCLAKVLRATHRTIKKMEHLAPARPLFLTLGPCTSASPRCLHTSRTHRAGLRGGRVCHIWVGCACSWQTPLC